MSGIVQNRPFERKSNHVPLSPVHTLHVLIKGQGIYNDSVTLTFTVNSYVIRLMPKGINILVLY